MSMPELSPLVAHDLVCHDCGKIIQPTVVMGNRGRKKVVTHLEYRHVNKEAGCNYKVESNAMTSMEMRPMREDGSEVQLEGQ